MMLGDEPDPSVTTTRVGFGKAFGRARGVVSEGSTKTKCLTTGPGEDRRETKSKVASVVGLETVNESKGGRGNYQRMQVL